MEIVVFVILGLLGFFLIYENSIKTNKIKELNEQLEESEKACRYFARQYSRLKNAGNISYEGVDLFNMEKEEKELNNLINEFNFEENNI